MDVFYTVDVEWWPESWATRRSDFDSAFKRYIHGETGRGDVGLAHQLRMAREYDLKFVFFVESLFAFEFGLEPLKDVVAMIRDAGQEVQLHAHPEWVRHAEQPVVDLGEHFVFEGISQKVQSQLVTAARDKLLEAGADEIDAFRAGSFAADRRTLRAVAEAGIRLDSSLKMSSELVGSQDEDVRDIVELEGVVEYPLSMFRDGMGRERQAQLGSCSSSELSFLLESAKSRGWRALVLLSHSAELLNGDRTRPDAIVVRRFESLCRALADNRDRYPTRWFRGVDVEAPAASPRAPVKSGWWRTLTRAGEQAARRFQ